MYGSSHTLRAAAIVASAGLALLAAACGSSSKFTSASSPTAGKAAPTAGTPAEQAQLENEYLRFARCMRSHGVSAFPDPITGSGGHPGFSLQGGSSSDLNPNPAFQRGVEACQHILGHQFRFVFTPSGVGKGA